MCAVWNSPGVRTSRTRGGAAECSRSRSSVESMVAAAGAFMTSFRSGRCRSRALDSDTTGGISLACYATHTPGGMARRGIDIPLGYLTYPWGYMPRWHYRHAGQKEPMKLNQYYLDCLSHASYLIGDETTGRAVVVDPRRDISEYLAGAKELGFTIELVIETHFHADFLSGHLELAKATGAKIVYSCLAETEFESMGVADGERYSLGDVTLEFRHTPGHTPESLSIVVYEHTDDEVPYGVLTGDTLFIGDVGRPDLLASIGFTRDELADKLYDSLHDRLMTLSDETRVFPAHGAGSPCCKNLSTDLWSTIGDQKATNYALRAPDKASFVALVTEGQPP